MQFIPFVNADDSGSPKHIPRVVSIVFDDSGSMYDGTDRWAYTSYAMQAFCAMMGNEDTLYVTYLNARTDSVKIDLSSAKKQQTFDAFEATMFGGPTPNRLSNGVDPLIKEYKTHGRDAKYYFIVMADGQLDYGSFATDLPDMGAKAKNAMRDARCRPHPHIFLYGK